MNIHIYYDHLSNAHVISHSSLYFCISIALRLFKAIEVDRLCSYSTNFQKYTNLVTFRIGI